MPVKLIKTTKLGVETYAVIEVTESGEQTTTPVRTYLSEVAARQYIARKYRSIAIGEVHVLEAGRIELLAFESNGKTHELEVHLQEV